MRIVVVTDAWKPQVNGVVRTYEHFGNELTSSGDEVLYVTPNDYHTIPLPGYPEIRLALFPYRKVARTLREFKPNAIHIGTEGPLGMAARRYCLRKEVPFTTAFHTRFPEYVRMRVPVPASWTYGWLRRFHDPADRTMVPTESQKLNLESHGFKDIRIVGRGVDTSVFHPGDRHFLGLPRPIQIYMGRVAVEKNIEAFLHLDTPGSKVVIGDGPDRVKLERDFPNVLFAGYRFGSDLARHLASGDVFVFPSRTDTFGIVLIEAMACGLPVAAYPVDGPRDVVQQGITGWLDEDLGVAVEKALTVDPADCIHYSHGLSWKSVSREFKELLAPIPGNSSSFSTMQRNLHDAT